MDHADLAQLGAILGAVGSGAVLLWRSRPALFAGFAVIAAAEVLLAYALVPGHDLNALVSSPARVASVALLVLLVALLAVIFARIPAVTPVGLLIAAPFRVPVTLGDQEAFLLVPLYVVLVAAVLGLLARSSRREALAPIPRVIAIPSAAFIGLSGLSLLWSDDLRAGIIHLLFFLLPFAALLAVVARAPFEQWLPRALGVTFVVIACALAAVGLSQLWTEDLYFARDLEVANAYTSYFRTTSLFADSSLYARELVIAIVIVLAALWLGQLRLWIGAALMAFLWAGLFFSYSQSSMIALAVAALALSLVLADRSGRRLLAAGALLIVVVSVAAIVTTVHGDSAQRFTSGRSELVQGAWGVFVDNPVVGVGVGAQPEASRDDGGRKNVAKNASHTTPLTVAAELGVVGLLAYAAFLAGAAVLLLRAVRVQRGLGLGLSAALLLLFVHSLFYSGFFEDPLTWGILGVAAAAVSRVGAEAPVVDLDVAVTAPEDPSLAT